MPDVDVVSDVLTPARRTPPSLLTRGTTLAFVFAIALLALPVILVRIPPVLDYPDHYVRMWLLSGGIKIYPVSTMYSAAWNKASTNIGIDVLAILVGSILPVAVLGRLVLFAAVTLPPLGAALLHRQVFRHAHWWQIVLVMLAWSETLVFGLVNFQISLGLALLGAALDARLMQRGMAFAVIGRMLIGTVVLLVHPFGLLFYAALVGALTLGPSLAPMINPRMAGIRIVRAIVACLPILVPLAVLLILASQLPGAHPGSGNDQIIWQGRWIRGHILMMLTPFTTYDLKVDLVYFDLFALLLIVSMVSRCIRIHAGLLLVSVLLIILSNFMPIQLADTAEIDKCLPPMAFLTLAAAVRPELPLAARWNGWVLAGALFVVVSRTLWITHVWVDRQTDVGAVERTIRLVPPGSAVLAMEDRPSSKDGASAPVGRFMVGGQPVFWHYGTLAIAERHAFVPTLFTAAGKQPITVLPPWDQIAVPQGVIPPVHLLDDPQADAAFPYLRHWRDRFNFVLVLNADMPNASGPLPARPELQLVADEGFARLYRIVRDADDAAKPAR